MLRRTAAALLLLLANVGAAGAADAVSVTIEAHSVVATGVKPGTKVAFFGIAHEAHGYRLRIVDAIVVIEDEDRDGVVRFAAGRGISPESTWAVVDVDGGKSAVRRGNARQHVRKNLAPAVFRRRSANASAALVFPQEIAIVCLVRPAVGVWMRTVRDSGASDGDGANDGVLTAQMNDMRPVDKKSPAPPDDFVQGDLVFVLDPFTLEISEGVWSANGQ